MEKLTVTSGAFRQEGMIPSKYTCDGADVSPPLSWSKPPAGTRSLALISDDPDAPGRTWVHWVVYNIPPGTTSLPEGVPRNEKILGDALQGKNDFGRVGYGGPCPPGGTHRYFFKLYALDAVLDLRSGATKNDVLSAMEGHVLAQGELMGKYKRK